MTSEAPRLGNPGAELAWVDAMEPVHISITTFGSGHAAIATTSPRRLQLPMEYARMGSCIRNARALLYISGHLAFPQGGGEPGRVCIKQSAKAARRQLHYAPDGKCTSWPRLRLAANGEVRHCCSSFLVAFRSKIREVQRKINNGAKVDK